MKIGLFLALFLAGSRLLAQCPGETVQLIDSGYYCQGDTLAVTATAPISQIVWYKDGQVVKTVTANYIISPVAIIAGGNGEGAAANQFAEDYQVCVDGNGYLYVADFGNIRVQRFPPGSTSRTNGTTVATSPIHPNNNYFGVCLDSHGNLYTSDEALDAVQQWAPGATSGITVAGGHGDGAAPNQFVQPGKISTDAAGNLYVADGDNSRIQKWAPGAVAGVTVAGGNGQGGGSNNFNGPIIAVPDNAGNLYIADVLNQRVQKWAPGATAGVTVAGGHGQGSAANQLNYPLGLCVDNDGNVYVADHSNHRIQKWGPGATEGVTVAGGNGPGAGFNQLDNPCDVFLDSQGKLYIADSLRVLKLQQTIYSSIDSMYVTLAGGVYTAVVTLAGSCSMSSNPVVIRPSVNPNLNVNPSANPICAGDTVLFTASVVNTGFNPAFQWQMNGAATGDNSPSYTDLHPSNGDAISCTVSDAPSCLPPTAVSVVMIVNPVPAVAPNQVFSVAYGHSITLAPALTGDIAFYAWTPGAGLSDTTIRDPVANPLATTRYNLKLVTPEGCADSGDITVYVYIPLSIPGAFTPNGDGRNDVFYVLGGPAGLVLRDFAVFDRWGQRVFQVHDAPAGDPAFGWNGLVHGSPAPTGAYVYILSIKLPDGQQQQSQGTVMLIR